MKIELFSTRLRHRDHVVFLAHILKTKLNYHFSYTSNGP